MYMRTRGTRETTPITILNPSLQVYSQSRLPIPPTDLKKKIDPPFTLVSLLYPCPFFGMQWLSKGGSSPENVSVGRGFARPICSEKSNIFWRSDINTIKDIIKHSWGLGSRGRTLLNPIIPPPPPPPSALLGSVRVQYRSLNMYMYLPHFVLKISYHTCMHMQRPIHIMGLGSKH